MAALRKAFPVLTVAALAEIDPEILARHITNLPYYNTKANQIVKATKEIKVNYNGVVPEDKKSLLNITGIGRVFADLLATVNTRNAHNVTSASFLK